MFNITQNISSLKRIREFIKWFIIIGSLLMTLHCGFLILGVNFALINFIFGMSFSGYITLMLSTFLLGFCNNIRFLLTYIFAVRCCVTYQVYYGFGLILTPMRLFMVILGFSLIFKTIYDAYVKGDDIKTIERNS